MRDRCFNCGDEQEIEESPPRVTVHALEQLAFPVEIQTPRKCMTCGREVGSENKVVAAGRKPAQPPRAAGRPATEQHHGSLWRLGGTQTAFLTYPGVRASGHEVLYPVQEGSLSDGHAIDRYGDPELMAEVATEYLKQYWAIVPKGRLPRVMAEMMPALNLLVNAAELALKADLIRSGRNSDGHRLPPLLGRLEDAHGEEIKKRFAESAPITDLRALGAEAPTVESVLGVYERGFGWSPVYESSRYLAEPTTKVRSKEVKGGNLVQGLPYPIFLPVVVQSALEAFAHFSGAERLRRLGARVERGTKDAGRDQHGDWALVPSSLGLVVLLVGQFVASTEGGERREEFQRFIEARPPLYCTSWMYGGNTLMFYRASEVDAAEGETTLDGLECKVWRTGALAMHSRDLFGLADAFSSE